MRPLVLKVLGDIAGLYITYYWLLLWNLGQTVYYIIGPLAFLTILSEIRFWRLEKRLNEERDEEL